MEKIIFSYYGRGGLGSSYIQILFKDGTSQTFDEVSTLPEALIFTYSTGSWTVVLNGIETEDPKIEGVVYRNGNQLMISTG